MKTPPVEGWQPTKVKYPVAIPTLDGRSVSRTIEVEIDAWKNSDEEIFLDDDAEQKIEAVKSRHMGLLTTTELKQLRDNLGITQKELSELLQLGEKTWTRWESGRERPSRSMNLLLCALRDGKVDLGYLEALRLGRSLTTMWLDEMPPLSNRPFQYKISHGRQQLRPTAPNAARVALDTSFVTHLCRAAYVRRAQETLWCERLLGGHGQAVINASLEEEAADAEMTA